VTTGQVGPIVTTPSIPEPGAPGGVPGAGVAGRGVLEAVGCAGSDDGETDVRTVTVALDTTDAGVLEELAPSLHPSRESSIASASIKNSRRDVLDALIPSPAP